MKKSLFFITIGLLPIVSQAEVMDPESALERALDSFSKTNSHMKMPRRNHVSLSATVDGYDNQPAVYIFNRLDNGCYFVSADDNAAPLLGYSDSGTYNPDDVNPNLRYWLEQYAAQIDYVRQNPSVLKSAVTADRSGREPIAPLCSTMWNQDAPYNNMCPFYNGERTVTGCVATAMAQIMAYHRYPASASFTGSYTIHKSASVSVGFDSTLEWGKMLDSYSESYSSDQASAVARLMYGCGLSVAMQYDISSNGGSGAYSTDLPIAYNEKFGYRGSYYALRDSYSDEEWEQMIYDNLVNYGPVQYSGTSSLGGHSFVCDGYSHDGYFHINWGWGGTSDSYFLLSALSPGIQGIGGSNGGFNTDQAAILRISTDPALPAFTPVMYGKSDFVLPSQAYSNERITISFTSYNYSGKAISGRLLLKYTPLDGSDAIYSSSGSGFTNLGPNYGYSYYYDMIPGNLVSGKSYRVTPCFYVDGYGYTDIPVPPGYTRFYYAVVDGNTVNFFQDPVSISDVSAVSEFHIGQLFKLSFKVTNRLPDVRNNMAIKLAFINKGTNDIATFGKTIRLDLAPGETAELDYISDYSDSFDDNVSVLSETALPAGDYELAFFNPENFNVLHSSLPVVSVRKGTVTTASATAPVVAHQKSVLYTDFNAKSSLSVKSGYFGNNLSLRITPDRSNEVVDTLHSDYLFMPSGKSAPISFSGALHHVNIDEFYNCTVYHGETPVSEPTRFYVGNPTGVNDISTDPADTHVKLFDLQGHEVDPSNAQPGHYIRTMRDANGVKKSVHVIVK